MRRYIILALKNQKIEGFITRDFNKVEDFSKECIHYSADALFREVVVKRNSKMGDFNLLVSEYKEPLSNNLHKKVLKGEIAPIPAFDYEFEEKLDKQLQKASYDSPEYDIF